MHGRMNECMHTGQILPRPIKNNVPVPVHNLNQATDIYEYVYTPGM